MIHFNNTPKIFSGLWCGARKRPGAFTQVSVGHLRVAFLFNFLKYLSYEQADANR